MNNNGAVGEGVSWFAAIIIVFFLVLFMVLLSVILVGGDISSKLVIKEDLDMSQNFDNANYQTFLNLLSLPIEDETFEQMIFNWSRKGYISLEDETLLKQKCKDFLEPLISEDECYYVEFKSMNDILNPFIFSKPDVGSRIYRNSIKFDLFYGEEKIKSIFFLGDCDEVIQ